MAKPQPKTKTKNKKSSGIKERLKAGKKSWTIESPNGVKLKGTGKLPCWFITRD